MRAAADVSVLLLSLLTASTATTTTNNIVTVDVLVISANAAGIGAGIAARGGINNTNNNDTTVLIMERLPMIGGMAVSVGLMNEGAGDEEVTGLGKVWGEINGNYYHPNASAPVLNVFPDPFVAANSWWAMVNATPGLSLQLGCRLLSVSFASSSSPCLTSADFSCTTTTTTTTTTTKEISTSNVTVFASIFIDASYDGDILVAAGGVIEYANGRESSAEFNESLAGVNLLDYENESFDKQNLTIDAFFPNGTILPGISSDPLLPAGSGDDRLMAFSYFPCVTTDPANSIPYYKPDNYNPDDFTLLQRQIEGVMANGMYPEGPDLAYFSEYAVYDTAASSGDPSSTAEKLLLCCGRGPVNCDQPDLNRGWATANYTEKLRIEAAHKYYLLGSLYYMANDPRVPNYTQYAISRWGLCKDSYAEFGYWPPQMYIRISNRLRGEALLTQNNLANPQSKNSSVSMGCWEFDQHTMSRHAVPPKNASYNDGSGSGSGSTLIAMNEGYMRYDLTAPFLPCSHPEAKCHQENKRKRREAKRENKKRMELGEEMKPITDNNDGNWYDVPFEAILPKRGQANNLLVPVAISATSIAYSSTRIEIMYLDLGVAAGVAARLALVSKEKGHENKSDVTHSLLSNNDGQVCPSFALQDTNITAVQEILVMQYNQRIHGPI